MLIEALDWLSLFIVGMCVAGMYQVREANQMVEEFMLAANISVSEKILNHFPSFSLLRSEKKHFGVLVKFCFLHFGIGDGASIISSWGSFVMVVVIHQVIPTLLPRSHLLIVKNFWYSTSPVTCAHVPLLICQNHHGGSTVNMIFDVLSKRGFKSPEPCLFKCFYQ